MALGALLSGTKVLRCRSGCSPRSRRRRPARSSRTSGSARRWRSRGSCRRRIRRTVGGAIHDAGGRQTIWRRRVCRQRAAHRTRFCQQLQLSETGRVSFQLCTRGDISTLRGHCSPPHAAGGRRCRLSPLGSAHHHVDLAAVATEQAALVQVENANLTTVSAVRVPRERPDYRRQWILIGFDGLR
jgi:hypothetical protein